MSDSKGSEEGSDARSHSLPRNPSHWDLVDKHHNFSLLHRPTMAKYRDNRTGATYRWNSRSHRKGVFPRPLSSEFQHIRPSFRLWSWEWQSISWWVCQMFLIGSCCWCVNGTFSFLTLNVSAVATSDTIAWTAFGGGSFFLIGAVLSYWESLNPPGAITTGRKSDEKSKTVKPIFHDRRHFGTNQVQWQQKDSDADSDASSQDEASLTELDAGKWRWIGWRSGDFGFLANAIQLYGASIFWVSTLCGVPGLLPDNTDLTPRTSTLWIVFFWSPQILGAPAFVISGFMFMLEVWDRPLPLFSLGWHVGLWNMLGGWGFFWSGVFGIWAEIPDGTLYQHWGTAFSTFLGSWFFLLGSYLQLLEIANKHHAG